MGATALVSLDIEKGRAVVRALDEAGLDVRAASWLLVAEVSGWRLVLAMPLVDRKGERAGYQAIQKVLARQPATLDVLWHQISVVGLKDPLYRLLRRVARTGRRAVADIRFSDHIGDDVFVEDGYIYRSS